MIISHKYRFMFIHCRKVAGSSIKNTLWPYLGDDDIVIGSLDEILKNGHTLNSRAKKTLYHPRALNVTRKAFLERWRYGNTNRYRNLVNTAVKAKYKKTLFRNPVHSPAEAVKRYFPYEWENYYKFCFVRNPFDQALSEYFYQTRGLERDVSFSHFLKAMAGEVDDPKIVPHGFRSNWPLYTCDDELAIDYAGKYESIEEEFKIVCQHLGVPCQDRLMKEKKAKGDKGEISSWYSEDDIQRVRSIYADEIRFFGY
ncbi:sulfotransferase family 2 domain-containing protein [Chromohalobacter sp. 11-W]|uniref:sulfotransferase family 2 domain-containing protein n=1 Tax=Chromohalobacter sp. 11-W TaxID=2994061 RepID=UPI002468C9E1|nr:sulfotransferase family 2 domain-containing protein [Chromohalobacter sp. 11-W]